MSPFTIIGAGISAMGGMKAAKGVQQAGEYNKQIYDRNSEVEKNKAEYAQFKNELAISRFREKFQQLNKAASQAYMKSGIVSTSGTALEVQLANAVEAEKDIQMMKVNAEAEKTAYIESSINMKLTGQLKKYEADMQARSMRTQAMGSLLSSFA